MKWGTPEDRSANLRPLDSILDRDCPGFQRWIDPAEGFIYIDLDHVRKTDTGEVEAWAQDIVDQFDTYTEISASGTGFHIVCKGKLPEDFVLADNKTEIYSGHINKLMALTGNIIGDFPTPIERTRHSERDKCF
jgi:primase-polymerase (primpol)-like protein